MRTQSLNKQIVLTWGVCSYALIAFLANATIADDVMNPAVKPIDFINEYQDISFEKNKKFNLMLSCSKEVFWGIPLQCQLVFMNNSKKKIKIHDNFHDPKEGSSIIYYKLKSEKKWRMYFNSSWGRGDTYSDPIFLSQNESMTVNFTLFRVDGNNKSEYIFPKEGVYQIIAMLGEAILLQGIERQKNEKANKMLVSNIVTVTVKPPADKLSKKLCKLIMNDSEIMNALNYNEGLDLEDKDDQKLIKRIEKIIKQYPNIKNNPYLNVLKKLYDDNQPGKKPSKDNVPDLKKIPTDSNEDEGWI